MHMEPPEKHGFRQRVRGISDKCWYKGGFLMDFFTEGSQHQIKKSVESVNLEFTIYSGNMSKMAHFADFSQCMIKEICRKWPIYLVILVMILGKVG